MDTDGHGPAYAGAASARHADTDPPTPCGLRRGRHRGANTDEKGDAAEQGQGQEQESTGLRVYLAARFARAREMQLISRVLARSGGVVVTSRWHGGSHEFGVMPMEVMVAGAKAVIAWEQGKMQEWALEDLEDMAAAEAVVLFTDPPETLDGKSGGRHFECGWAHAQGRQVIVVGEPENVFHLLPGIIRVTDRGQLVRLLGFANRRDCVPNQYRQKPVDLWREVDEHVNGREELS